MAPLVALCIILAFLEYNVVVAEGLERHCRPKICDIVLKTCYKVHTNTTQCQERADKISHCCYSCMDCPPEQHQQQQQQPPVAATPSIPKKEVVAEPQMERHCHPGICDTVLKACYRVHDNTTQCQERADKVSHCCYSCMDCPPEQQQQQQQQVAATPSKEPEMDLERHCHPKICDTVLKTCYKVHDNTSECQERADKASHCCYSCMDCPPVVPTLKHDTCKADLCNAVWNVCTASGDHKPAECWKISDEAADCCDECGSCKQSQEEAQKHHKDCQREACEESFQVCRNWFGVQDRKQCWDVADDTFNCCDRCHDCN